MKKIYLFCNAGMSTSVLATNMQEIADEKKLPIQIEAISFSDMRETMEHDCPDVILLGPQIKYMYEELCSRYYDYHRPIAVIDGLDYGMLNGKKVLNQALQLMEAGE